VRIRSTKPEFWRSKKIASVSWDARLVLKGLESYVDDNGVGKDDVDLIVSDLFSRDALRDPSRTLARLSEAISELSEAGLVARYVIDGEDLLYIVNWKTAQRIDKPARGRFPRPDGTLDYSEPVDEAAVQASFASPREPSRALAPGTGEQGNRGTEKDTSASAAAEREFDEFWQLYPKRKDKGHAVRAFKAARRKADQTNILDGLRRCIDTEWRDRAAEYIPYPATWLNGERWADEAVAAPTTTVRHLPHASEIEQPPDGLSPSEYAAWERKQRERRRA
jgi:hypothetical protein